MDVLVIMVFLAIIAGASWWAWQQARSRALPSVARGAMANLVRGAEARLPEEPLDALIHRIGEQILRKSERTLSTRVLPESVVLIVAPELASRITRNWDSFTDDLANYVLSSAADEDYVTGDVRFTLAENERFHRRRVDTVLNSAATPAGARVRRSSPRPSGDVTQVVGRAQWLIEPPSGKAVPLAEGRSWKVGAGGTCDIIINEPIVSREHASITAKGDSLTITDLSSTNGTWHDKKKLDRPLTITKDTTIDLAGRVPVRFVHLAAL
ncbi:FHA domain-containing protein [Hoyosella sp. G463]|uniref:FHA domain-containing protein n=1 Tax=Lolliginicoccus lacisalsi TaxID=2742202 RepID=A0A927JD14_9ACTN|nr:FHA domain-containing protein [Lolliginicoccus lacisalsi]MBD8506920.1 FHA domain-containing protein [Lolliginicoccus lacisalsi]